MSVTGYDLLIVDDQAGVRLLLAEAFLDYGYSIKLAASGMEALAMLPADVSTENIPRLILLDIKMPGLSGLETLKEIRRRNIHVPVVMMTAYGESDIIIEAKSLGVQQYINKPFDINEIRSLVKGMLDQALDRTFLQEIG